MASPTFAWQSSNNPGTSYTKPTVSTGDYMVIVHFGFNTTVATPTAPSGWSTAINHTRQRAVGDDFWEAIFYRLVDGSEGAGPYAVTDPGGGSVWWSGGGMFVVTGAPSSSVSDDTGTNAGNSGAPSTGANIDASVADDLAIVSMCTDEPAAHPLGSITALDTSTTKELDMGNTCVYYERLSATHAGATYSTTFAGSDHWVAGFLLMKAAAGGGGATPFNFLALLGVGA